MSSTNALQFDRFLADEVTALYGPNWAGELHEHIVLNALHMQALTLMDRLRDAFLRCPPLSDQVKAPRALYFLRYGAGRRLNMMWRAYRNLVFVVPPDRKEPLINDESGELTEGINIIYLNIRGVMDNLCWALLHEHAQDLTTLPPAKVGLFLPSFTKDERFADLVPELKQHDAWDRDLKSRRDPAAHQIPLSIPPQIVTPSEAAEYQKAFDDYWASAARQDFDGAEAIMRRIEQMGRFMPWFVHDPDQPPMPIYPTVSNDIGHLVVIFDVVSGFLSNHAS